MLHGGSTTGMMPDFTNVRSSFLEKNMHDACREKPLHVVIYDFFISIAGAKMQT